jgi:hypothetical protein
MGMVVGGRWCAWWLDDDVEKRVTKEVEISMTG